MMEPASALRLGAWQFLEMIVLLHRWVSHACFAPPSTSVDPSKHVFQGFPARCHLVSGLWLFLLQCLGDDRLFTGSCNFIQAGSLNTPICSDKDTGAQVLCQGPGPIPTGWACNLGDGLGDFVEAAAVCCALSLPNSFILNFDDIPTPLFSTLSNNLQSYKGFNWQSSIFAPFAVDSTNYASFLAGGDAPEGCTNGITNGVVSTPNVLSTFGATSMTAPPGFVFSVTSLNAASLWLQNVLATFRGFSSEGTELGTVTATVNPEGPTLADLTPLGRISTLQMEASCGDAFDGSCFPKDDICSGDSFDELIIDDIVVTREL
jgi:hypothetical protein